MSDLAPATASARIEGILDGLYPGPLALLLIPVCQPRIGHTHGGQLCTSPGKRPLGRGWNSDAVERYQNDSDRDAHLARIASHVAEGGNVGWVVSPGVLVLDCDSAASTAWIAQTIPDAPVQRTNSGAHFFVKPPVGIEMNAEVAVEIVDGVAVDLRVGGRSQVVCDPSSHVSGGTYTFKTELPEDLSALPPCPPLIAEAIRKSGRKETSETSVSIDTPVFEEHGRNNALFRLGSRLRRGGLSTEELRVSLESVNQSRCQPPLDQPEVHAIAASAARYPAATRDAEDLSSPFAQPNVERVPFRPARGLDERSNLSSTYHVKSIVPRDSTGFVYGWHSVGKTFWVMRLMAAIADGKPFLGRRTKPGLVFYFCGEGATGIDCRCLALRISGHLQSDNLFVRPVAPNMLDDLQVAEAIELIQEVVDRSELPVALIVFDTLSRHMPGGDENPGTDTSLAISNADRVRQAFPGSSALYVAHTGKDATKGVRGHSNQPSNAEFMIELRREANSEVGTWRVAKQKDGECGAPDGYRLETVDLGVADEDGDPIRSCVMTPAQIDQEVDSPAQENGLTKRPRECWDTIQNLLGPAASPLRPGVTRDEIRDALDVENQATRRGTLRDGLPPLVARGLIHESEGMITYGERWRAND